MGTIRNSHGARADAAARKKSHKPAKQKENPPECPYDCDYDPKPQDGAK